MGKSYALIIDAIRDAHNKHHNAIIFRRTNDELRELIFQTQLLYPRIFPGAKFDKQKSTWLFPSGARIWFTYLDRDEDVTRYQGQAFTYIAFDELTQWPTPFAWDYMRSRLRRSVHIGIKPYMRATCNPGGVGGWWVKKMFIDPQPLWGKPFVATDIETGVEMRWKEKDAYKLGKPELTGKPLFYRRFIPARLTDNPYLVEDEAYYATLLSLPESQQRQLLEGDWDVAEGAAFTEFNRSVHVIEPFDLDPTMVRFRAADWGYSSPACCLWFAVDYDNNIFVYRELYVNDTKSGEKIDAEEFGKLVKSIESHENVRYGVLDSSTWAKRGDLGPSIAEQMIRVGCRWRPADRSPNSRTNGRMEVHRRLKVDPDTGLPSLFIFNTCQNLIRTLPVIPIDKKNPEDVDTKFEDHAYDALRYGLMSRPKATSIMDNYNASKARYAYHKPVDPVFGY